MNRQQTQALILRQLQETYHHDERALSSSQLHLETGISLATLKRHLNVLVDSRRLVRSGRARATRYHLPCLPSKHVVAEEREEYGVPQWSQASQKLRKLLQRPLLSRRPVGYERAFVDSYEPNKSCLLPRKLAEDLAQEARMPWQNPIGSFASKVLQPLLIDLSWSSSHLEGNRYSLPDTEEMFEKGFANGDFNTDVIMLFNHKRAIEFMVETVPHTLLTATLIKQLHLLLMSDLLSDDDMVGNLRHGAVRINGSTYLPLMIPAQIEELFDIIIGKAAAILNPVEAAFFLWVNIAYLQGLLDGNKRTSRLAANVPLMIHNCAPLSFLDVGVPDYSHAMLGVYEFQDVSIAVDLFAWTYRRSVEKYLAVLQKAGPANPFRLRHRENLIMAVQAIVFSGLSIERAIGMLTLPGEEVQQFRQELVHDLAGLSDIRATRYRLSTQIVEAWIARGRPR
ncbi:MAG: Fic family protein [Janthinobacterium lividum]